MFFSKALTVAALTVVGFSGIAKAIVLHDESVNGDLSGDRLNPASFVLTVGTNSILATSLQGDIEYVHFSLPAGLSLTQVIPVNYVSSDGTAFIGVQAGTQFTEPPATANVANILGYTHFGTGPGNVGQNILPDIGTGAGAIGFTPPLTGSDYTFWIQQTSSSNPTTYQFDFVVVPEPAAMMGLVPLALLLQRRR